MTTNQDREAIEKVIKENPNDPAPHLVYADWLEERGHEKEAERERWLAKVIRRPYDPALRWRYARWLMSQRRDKEADLNFWVATVLKGKTDYDLVLTRRRPVDQRESGWNQDWWSEEVRADCQRRAKEVFTTHPGVQLIVVGDGPPEHNGFLSRATFRVSGVTRSPVVYLDRRDEVLYRVEEAPKVWDRDTRLCPFCGWDLMGDYGHDCPHFVTDMTEWPPNHAGTDGGTFGKVADEVLEPLAEAVWSYLSSGGPSEPNVRSSIPGRLFPVIEAVAQEGEPYDNPSEECHPVKSAFQEYVRDVFRWTTPEREVTTYDSGDWWGTWPVLYWSSNARKTAREMARLVAQDVKQLRREIPRP
jgi:uncharacterized protein (TIGR02996 family)